MSVCTKVLTVRDVKRSFSFPEDYVPAALATFQGCEAVPLLVTDEVGVLWNFICRLRSGASRKLVIRSGWFQFVRSRRLRKGDTVSFYREDDRISGAHYKIEVKKSRSISPSVNTKNGVGLAPTGLDTLYRKCRNTSVNTKNTVGLALTVLDTLCRKLVRAQDNRVRLALTVLDTLYRKFVHIL